MQFAPMSIAEQEVVIRLDRETGQAHLSSTWPDWSRKLAKLYGHPSKVSKSSRDGRVTCAFWTVPPGAVRLRRVQAKRELTEEQRERLAARLETARFFRQAHKNSVGQRTDFPRRPPRGWGATRRRSGKHLDVEMVVLKHAQAGDPEARALVTTAIGEPTQGQGRRNDLRTVDCLAPGTSRDVLLYSRPNEPAGAAVRCL